MSIRRLREPEIKLWSFRLKGVGMKTRMKARMRARMRAKLKASEGAPRFSPSKPSEFEGSQNKGQPLGAHQMYARA